MGRWDDFDTCYRPPSSAEPPKPLYEYEQDAAREIAQPELESYVYFEGYQHAYKEWERDVRERARQLRERDDRQWREEADARRAEEIYANQPSPQEFTSLLQRELETAIRKQQLRPELLEPFLSVAQSIYQNQPFRFHATKPIDYLEHMATRGPRLVLQGLTEIFIAYASHKPSPLRLRDMHAVASDGLYSSNRLFERISFNGLPFDEVPKLSIPDDLPFSGTWVVSPQGRGKTTLLSTLILERMNQPGSIVIFDSKGDLAGKFRTRALPKSVVTIDPLPFLALNPLDLGTHSVGTLMTVYSMLLGAAFTPLQSVLLRQTLYLASLIPGATLTTIKNILATGAENYQTALQKMDDEERSFWTGEQGFKSKTYAATKSEIAWRLDLLRPPQSVLRSMFNAPKTRIKLPELMDTNTLTIINNSRALLDPMQSEFFARLFLVMILGAAEQRAHLSDAQKNPCYIFIDEADTVIKTATELADIIYRCRSQRIAMLCAHQSLSQIEDKQVQSALGDCAIKYANSGDDAHALAPKLRTSPETLSSLQVGEFALSLRAQPTQVVKIPLPDFSPYALLSEAELEARDAEMVRRYHYTPQKPVPTPDETDDWGGKRFV